MAITIDEAIEIKLNWRRNQKADLPIPLAQADNLSIEALKRCKYIAEHTERWARVLLPGEAES